MFKFIAALAQPLKTLYIAFLLVFAVAFLTVLVGNLSGGSPVPAQWFFGLLGLLFLLIGICLVADVNGSARSASRAAKGYKPYGVDYSKSWLSSVAYARCFGGFAAVVGVAFIVAALTDSGIFS